MINLNVYGGDDPPYISPDCSLTYMVVLDSVSKEETERIVDIMEDRLLDEFEDYPIFHYLWWGKQKVGIIFSADDKAVKQNDAIKKSEEELIHCPYVSMTGVSFKDGPDKNGVSRVSVYTNDKNAVLVSTSSTIFECYFK